MTTSPKEHLQAYLQQARDALVWKLDGLTEHEARLPRTPTGTNLLGIVKHAANVEAVYFGSTFDRPWPTPAELVDWEVEDDPQADWYATPQESKDGVVDLYRRVQAFADQTIAGLPLDAPGRVAHWGGADVTLLQILVHTTGDLQRHAGHADILREQLDGGAGFLADDSNMPGDGYDWPAYVRRLTAIADGFR